MQMYIMNFIKDYISSLILETKKTFTYIITGCFSY